MRSSPDKFCDRQTDGQTDDGEVIPICHHYSVEATQKPHIYQHSEQKWFVSRVISIFKVIYTEQIL
jgi:hypothetical protein